MSDPKAPNAVGSTRDVIGALNEYFPQLMASYNAQVGPSAWAQLEATQTVSPHYQNLQKDLFRSFAPELAQIGRDIDRQDRIANAETDVDILDTSGRKLAETFKSIDTGLNPEYYKARSDAGGKLSELLGSISVDGPNPEAERLVNAEAVRSGNLATPSATSTVGNALRFGDERMKRQAMLSQAINSATSFMQPANNASNFNAATTALNKPAGNSGISQFGGTKDQTGAAAYSSGNNLINTIGGFQQQAMDINANRRDVLDRMVDATPAISV